MAARNLLRRRHRSLVTLLGVGLGTAAYYVLVASGQGLKHEFGAVAAGLGGEITVQRAGVALPIFSYVTPAEVEAIAALDGVRGVSVLAIAAARLPDRSQFIVFGLDPTQPLLAEIPIVAGRSLRAGAGEMMLGRPAARHLGAAPGDVVELMGTHRFTVVGVYETGRGLADNAAMVELTDLQRAFQLGDQVNMVFVDLAESGRLDATAEAIRRLGTLDAGPSDSWTFTIRQFEVAERFARTLGLVALVIAGLGVASTLNLNVTERLQELGLLRALGWRRRRIARLIFLEGLFVSMAGALAGALLAAAFLRAFNAWRAAGSFGVTAVVPSAIGAATLLEGFLLATLAGALGSLPALVHGLRVRPAAALRTLT